MQNFKFFLRFVRDMCGWSFCALVSFKQRCATCRLQAPITWRQAWLKPLQCPNSWWHSASYLQLSFLHHMLGIHLHVTVTHWIRWIRQRNVNPQSSDNPSIPPNPLLPVAEIWCYYNFPEASINVLISFLAWWFSQRMCWAQDSCEYPEEPA